MQKTAEHKRLQDHLERKANWKKWGPYVSERSWGTVREDYSPLGDAWEYFPHDHARSRAYRWGEDGIAGISDLYQYIFHRDVVNNEANVINPAGEGTKAAVWYSSLVPSQGSSTLQLRLTNTPNR